jgi:hypothetical protein
LGFIDDLQGDIDALLGLVLVEDIEIKANGQKQTDKLDIPIAQAKKAPGKLAPLVCCPTEQRSQALDYPFYVLV